MWLNKKPADSVASIHEMIAHHAEGVAAAKSGKPLGHCPYPQNQNMMAHHDWTSGHREYTSEVETIARGFCVFHSTEIDRDGGVITWRVPLYEAVKAGRFQPKHVPLPAGITPSTLDHFEAHRLWPETKRAWEPFKFIERFGPDKK